MDEKKYLMNGEPVSARQIILEAKTLDSDYGADGFCFTSEAAQVLRVHGYEVGENHDYVRSA